MVDSQDCTTSDLGDDVAYSAFQQKVSAWLTACFPASVARDKEERTHRFLEEALELAQASGCSSAEAHQLVDYVFSRPPGEEVSEVGGVMVTLAGLCSASDIDLSNAAELELERIWKRIDAIRAKQARRPAGSPLPQ